MKIHRLLNRESESALENEFKMDAEKKCLSILNLKNEIERRTFSMLQLLALHARFVD